MNQRTITPQTAEALRALFRSEGFKPGKPPGLPAAALALDLRCYRRMRCSACRRRLTPRPWTDGAAYRLLCSCRCGHGTEV